MAVTILAVISYLIKICIVPTTKDAGSIIPHLMLLKIPAMVIYPTLGGYIDFCYGFTFIDLPWLNNFFSIKLSSPTEKSPPSFKMFY